MIFRIFRKYQIAIVLGGFLSFFVAKNLIELPEHLKFEMELELLSPAGGVATIYCDDGRGYRSDRRIDFAYDSRNEVSSSVYRFSGRIPCGLATKKIRFDPVWAEGEVVLRSFDLRTYRWMPVDLEAAVGNEFKIINSVDEFELLGNGVRIKSSGHDPIVEITDNVGRYFELRLVDVALLLVFLTAAIAITLKFFQLIVSFILLNGSDIERLRKKLEVRVDNLLDGLRAYVASSFRSKSAINISAYLFAFAISCYGSWLFLSNIYPAVGFAFISAFIGAQATVLLFMAVMLIIAALFRQSSRSWIFPGLSILLAATYVADAQLFRLNGMHLHHGLGILFEGGIENFQKNLEFTKLDKTLLTLYQVALLCVFLGAFIAALFLGKLPFNSRAKFSGPFYSFVFLIALVAVVFEQYTSRYTKPQSFWGMEQSDIPSYIQFFEAKDFIFEVPIKVGKFKYKEVADSELASEVAVRKRNVYLFILESVREDLLDERVAPNLWSFRNSAITFSKSIANGNATHYGWYSIVNSRAPLYWELYKNKKTKMGSESLLALKKMGYAINIHSSKDLSYLGADVTMFGSGRALLDYITEYKPENIPEMDRKVTDTLIESIGSNQKGSSFNIVFWDSTHYPYRWPSGGDSLYEPYAGSEDSGVSLNKARDLAISEPHMLMNRYKNSINFSDQLFGRFISSLKEQGVYEESIVIVVGDHGQQFMEHNYLMHGRTLFSQDLHVPLYIHAPGYAERKIDRVASQIDIMPTIFDLIGAKQIGSSISDGRSLLDSTESTSYGVAAAAGFKNTPFRYLAEAKDWKLLFDIDKNDPLSSKKLFVKKIYDSKDQEYIPGSGSKEDYRNFVDSKFGGLFGGVELPFITLTVESQ